MSQTYCNDTPDTGIGFIASTQAPDTCTIADATAAGGDALSKMGTSIPTPFARLFLYKSAFSEVNRWETSAPGNHEFDGHAANGQPAVATSYHKLISEWLDMMEFVFHHGTDRDMQATAWTTADEARLCNSQNAAHKKLGQALRANRKATLDGATTIHIFRYNGIIAGGTSPFTIVYASPNWRRDAAQAGVGLARGGGGNLFDDNVVPLYRRDQDFRRYLYRIRAAHAAAAGDGKALLADDLAKYIELTLHHYEPNLPQPLPEPPAAEYDDPANYDNVKDDRQGNIVVKGLALKAYKTVAGAVMGSDYMMRPTATRYKTENVDGATVEVPAPLVLTQQGNDGTHYWKGAKWDPATVIPPNQPYELTLREVPGSHNDFYPFVTADDLLEEKIVRVSYNINSQRYHTGSAHHTQFLLPVRRRLFQFFNIDDLDSLLTLAYDKDTDTVTVRLTIPVHGPRPVEITRTYAKADFIVCDAKNQMFNVAVFPFYRIEGSKVPNANVYEVMLGYAGADKSLAFYNISSLETPIEADGVQRMYATPYTLHYSLHEAFDLMELHVNGTRALLVPKMTRKKLGALTAQYTFCVDFGTTNTHVAYASKQSGIMPADVKDFDITAADGQTVLLNAYTDTPEDGMGDKALQTPLAREMPPTRLGQEQHAQMPIRTVTCETPNYSTAKIESKLFANVNIGFNYTRELTATKVCRYASNIKWPKRGDTKGPDRIQEFFRQLVWMMKNKAVLGDAAPDFKLVWTFPQAMRSSLQTKYKQYWAEARRSVGAVAQGINAEALNQSALESVAPYYSFLREMYGDTYANIDIGGGTSDLIYIDPNPKMGKKKVYSAKFAADDLWGDGFGTAHSKQNGILAAYRDSPIFAGLASTKRDNFKNFMDSTAQSSADGISFLFADDEYLFAQFLDGHRDFKRLLFAHASATIYYLALCMLRDNTCLNPPTRLSFTGMGSKYLHLLGDEATIGELASRILRYRLGKENVEMEQDVTVLFAPQPKRITAEGGVLLTSQGGIAADKSLVYGFKDEQVPEKATWQLPIDDIDKKKQAVMDEYDIFLALFEDPDIKSLMNEMEVNTLGLAELLAKYKDSSFTQAANEFKTLKAAGAGDNVSEPMFFWPLKGAIFQAGREIAAGMKK